MSEPFIAQITMFGGNFAPRNWAFCEGQLLAISTNQALFSLLGTTYGGDGRTTFALPDMKGRRPIHPGTGPGLTPRKLGEKSGTENNTLTVAQMPRHTHAAKLDGALDATGTGNATLYGVDKPANSSNPNGNLLATSASQIYYDDAGDDSTADLNLKEMNELAISGTADMSITKISGVALADSGGGQAVNNVSPFLAVNFIIALQGIYPSRN